jgi:hypothetical protein
MNLRMTKLKIALASLGAVSLAAGCSGPGTTNNDQGIAVTFLGYFATLGAGCTALPTQTLGGVSVPIGSGKPEPGTTLTDGNLVGIDPSSGFVAVVGVQNNLFAQAYRADRLLLEYFIPGASVQPPATTVPLALLAGPGRPATTTATVGGVVDPTNGGRNPVASSLPPTFNNTCNRVFSQTYIIPASIREWLNFNRDVLPEPPFQMELTARVSGLSSAGDRFETQAETIPVNIIPEVFVTPTEGTDAGTTNGFTDGTTGLELDPTTMDGLTTDETTSDTGVEQLNDAFDTTFTSSEGSL